MQKIMCVLLMVLACAFSATAFASDENASLVKSLTNSKNTELLFVLLSKQAAIHVVDEKSKSYMLTLSDVNPTVVYFSNRPARFSGQVDLEKFLAQWKKGDFEQTPPNAAMEAVRLNIMDQPSRSVNYEIVLKDPVYNKLKNELQFTIQALPGNRLPLPKMARSDYVAIFVDAVCAGCWGF